MKRRVVVSGGLLALLLVYAVTLILNNGVQPAEATGTITIKADGSIDPPSANLTTSDNSLYTFTNDNSYQLVVQRDNVVIDGGGYTLQGPDRYEINTGFCLEGRKSVTIKNVKVTGWRYGFMVNNTSTEIIIEENNITGNYIGVAIVEADSNLVRRNSVTNNDYGIVVAYAHYNNVYENRVIGRIPGVNQTFFGWSGISIGPYSENNTVNDNIVERNEKVPLNAGFIGGLGIELSASSGNVLRNNTMVKNSHDFEVYSTRAQDVNPSLKHYENYVDSTNTVDGKPIYYWINNQSRDVPTDAACVILVNCTDITVESLNLTGNYRNLQLICTANSQITRNNLTGSEYGIWLYNSTQIKVTENNVENSSWGIVSERGEENLMANNTVSNNHWGIVSEKGEKNLVASNTVRNNTRGIYVNYGGGFWDSYNNTYAGNNLVDNDNGIILERSSHCYVTGNNIVDGSLGSKGVVLYQSSSCHITGNNIDRYNYGIQIWTYSSGRPINNIISGNNVSRGNYGIYLQNADESIIFHNSFTENVVHAYSYLSYNNTWDSGYPSGGNLWSGYYDEDSFSGPGQNVSGGDGIWDQPYVIGSEDLDRYPFAPPKVILNIDLPLDGMTDPPPDAYTYYQGQTATVLAMSDLGYSFSHWEYDAQTSTDNPITITMNQSYTLMAVFFETPPPPAVPEFPMGLAMEAALIPVFIYLLWRKTQRRTRPP